LTRVIDAVRMVTWLNDCTLQSRLILNIIHVTDIKRPSTRSTAYFSTSFTDPRTPNTRVSVCVCVTDI